MKSTSAFWVAATLGIARADPVVLPRQATGAAQVPEYFDSTLPGPYPGPAAVGATGFLAQTNPVAGTAGLPSGTQAFIPNEPLETSQAIPSNPDNINIFGYMGNLSPYFLSPAGFGVAEYSLPSTCNITGPSWKSRVKMSDALR
jgi:hypothetical protein